LPAPSSQVVVVLLLFMASETRMKLAFHSPTTTLPMALKTLTALARVPAAKLVLPPQRKTSSMFTPRPIHWVLPPAPSAT